MKKWIWLALMLLLVISGCASTKVYILGIDVDQVITDMKAEDVEMIIFGATASILTHMAGHYLVAELVKADIDQRGFREVITNPRNLNSSDHRWIARAGFVSQLVVNTMLTSFEATRESYFTRGYTLATMLEIGTYPLLWSDWGDLKHLEDYSGNEKAEWAFYTGMSLYNFYAINKDKAAKRKLHFIHHFNYSKDNF